METAKRATTLMVLLLSLSLVLPGTALASHKKYHGPDPAECRYWGPDNGKITVMPDGRIYICRETYPGSGQWRWFLDGYGRPGSHKSERYGTMTTGDYRQNHYNAVAHRPFVNRTGSTINISLSDVQATYASGAPRTMSSGYLRARNRLQYYNSTTGSWSSCADSGTNYSTQTSRRFGVAYMFYGGLCGNWRTYRSVGTTGSRIGGTWYNRTTRTGGVTLY